MPNGTETRLTDALAGRHAARVAQARSQYRRLCLRNARPEEGDEDLLIQVLGLLGLRPEDFEADAAAAADLLVIEAGLAGQEKVEADYREAAGACERHQAARDAFMARWKTDALRLEEAESATGHALSRVRSLGAKRRDLEAAHPRLFAES